MNLQTPINGMQRALQSVSEISERMVNAPLPFGQGQSNFQQMPMQGDTFSRSNPAMGSSPLGGAPAGGDSLISNIMQMNQAKLLFDVNASVFRLMKKIIDQILDLLR